ncbi:MAG: glycosyltransferase family 39 protein [Acidobacteriia bacterium]|nr:glycosyltransferase family 39 protein [Terriglobia bacterium]
MQLRRSEWIDLLTVAGFCAFLFFYGLGAFGLTGADEPRYAQIAREMLARHDLITPVLYGKPWLEKPVLYYWLAAFFYKIFGVSDWAARLPSACLATLMVFAAYFHARRFRPGAELNAALMTTACAAMIGFSRAAATDMPLAAFFVLGMLAWHAWFATGRRLWLAAFYIAMGLGTLAKGPVAAVLAGVIVLAFALRERDLGIVWRTLWLPGITLYLAAALPWYIAVQVRNPNFFREFILRHNLERFAVQNLYHHKEPFWYFVPVLLLAVMPWTVYFVAALVEHLRNFRERAPGAPGHDPLSRFLVLWAAIVVVLFSISQAKLPGYILPAVPPCTLLVADWIQRRGEKPLRRWQAALHAAAVAALTVAAIVAPFLVAAKHAGQRAALPPQLKGFALGIGVIVFAAVLITLARRGLGMLLFVTLAPVIFGVAWLLRAGGPAMDAAISARPVAREIAQIEGGNRLVAIYKANRELEYGLAFYRNQPIPRYERGEVPAGDHLVVATQGAEHEIADQVGGRRVSRLGDFPPQRLEFFWISPPTPPHAEQEHHHHH